MEGRLGKGATSRRAALLGYAFIGAVVLLTGELAARVFEAGRPDYGRARRIYAGVERPWERSRWVPHPTLGYFANPRHPDHCAWGYRGPCVSPEPEPGVLRVVALGASVTYGTGVRRWAESYPARLEEALRERGVRAEVVNVSAAGWTSAEILAAWQHMARPLRPAVVVADLGANDLWCYFGEVYRTDYYGCRAPLQEMPSNPGSLVRASSLAGFLGLLLHGGPVLELNDYVPGFRPPSLRLSRPWERGELAIRANTRALVTLIRAEGARALVLPIAANPSYGGGSTFEAESLEAVRRNAREVSEEAAKAGATVAEDWAAGLGAERFADEIHLDAEGERLKAEAVAARLASML